MPDALESLLHAAEQARPTRVLVAREPDISYAGDRFDLLTRRGASPEPHRVVQVQGGAIAFKASAPNFLSATARWWLFGVLTVAGLLALVLAGVIAVRAQESDNAAIWMWPAVFSLVLTGMLFTLSYLTVMGFGKVDVDTTFGAAAPPEEDESAPAVDATVPADKAKDVAATDPISATFTVEMDAESVKEAFAVASGGAPVDGEVGYDEDKLRATFTPKTELTPGGAYTATIAKTAKSAAGTEMTADHVWEFAVKAAAGR